MEDRKPRLLLGVTGCIAAYKSVELLRFLQKAGAEVRVVMTESATEFVGPATFEALTGAPVGTCLLYTSLTTPCRMIMLFDRGKEGIKVDQQDSRTFPGGKAMRRSITHSLECSGNTSELKESLIAVGCQEEQSHRARARMGANNRVDVIDDNIFQDVYKRQPPWV